VHANCEWPPADMEWVWIDGNPMILAVSLACEQADEVGLGHCDERQNMSAINSAFLELAGIW